MVSISEPQDKLLDMRFAFERDLVRRKGTQAFSNAGILVLCLECENDFDRRSGTHVVCDNCKADRVRKQTKERVRRHRERNKYETESTKKIAQEGVITPDHWTNLMLALAQNAAAMKDQPWLEANKDLYTQAILGRSLDG